MRIIIYGAGAIGGVTGGKLALAGSDTLFIGRAHLVDALNEKGLKVISPSGSPTVRVKAVTGPDRIVFSADDVVFLTVKSQDTEAALTELKKYVRDIPVFCFQNSVSNEEKTLQFFPRTYGVTVRLPAVYLKDGEVIARRDPPGLFVIGRYPQGTDAIAEKVGQELRKAGFLIKVTPDVMPYKWDKLIANLANATGAITNARGREMDFINQAVRNEARSIMRQAGIRWITDEEMARDWPESAAPPRGTIDTEAQSSTWQSLARGTDSVETEYLNGEIVRLAAKLGLEAPLNARLVKTMKEITARHAGPGSYQPAQLMTMLGLNMPAGI
jgi:2-dehydropantoate 2-reductase